MKSDNPAISRVNKTGVAPSFDARALRYATIFSRKLAFSSFSPCTGKNV
jgi:hypothetical protein